MDKYTFCNVAKKLFRAEGSIQDENVLSKSCGELFEKVFFISID